MFVRELSVQDVAEALYADPYAAWCGAWDLCHEIAKALETHFDECYGPDHPVAFYPTDIRCEFGLWDPEYDPRDEKPSDEFIVACLSEGRILYQQH